MPDMKSAFKKAGVASSAKEVKCQNCGKSFVPQDPKHRLCSDCARKLSGPQSERSHASSFNFPEGYPDYFDADGAIKCEYLTDLAEKIAQRLGQDKLKMHQLRAFYGHVRRQQAALKAGRPFKEVSSEICKLKPFARERAEKRKVPNFFEEFIRRNVDKAQDQRSFSWGFLEHFQAVVAYCSGTIRER